jgi:hypothetical protein
MRRLNERVAMGAQNMPQRRVGAIRESSGTHSNLRFKKLHCKKV